MLEVRGYASIFNELDSVEDLVLPGAFKVSLRDNPRPAMFYEHRRVLVGHWYEVYEDDVGLAVSGVVKDSTLAGLISDGTIRGLSIGFRARNYCFRGKQRHLEEIQLKEISFSANPIQKLATLF